MCQIPSLFIDEVDKNQVISSKVTNEKRTVFYSDITMKNIKRFSFLTCPYAHISNRTFHKLQKQHLTFKYVYHQNNIVGGTNG